MKFILIQPYFIKYIWNPWEKKDEQGNIIGEPEFIKKCENGVCTFMRKDTTATGDSSSPNQNSQQSCPVSGATKNESKKDN
ncbi:hypothetical protein PVAND_003965 [Polypedilum vanderplanki]|uniref:Uncharacterized protein n=1 Tax=Polypedilum vanderplanki TaxID=319348 RepID=A0A9J6BVM1_POLVA|nr:hypothetical protein PVAND_003965 [Polypedilum vanderplanki]